MTRTWKAPECPFTIEYAVTVVDDIRLAVVDAFFSLPRGGAEIGGVLFGRKEDGRVLITDSKPLDCEHAYGPSFTLSPKDCERLAELVASARNTRGGQAIGWYHSHTRSELLLSDADKDIHRRYFPESWQVALVLKPHTFEPTRAAFFFAGQGGAIEGTPYQEFTLEPLPAQQVPSAPPQAAPPVSVPAAEPARGRQAGFFDEPEWADARRSVLTLDVMAGAIPVPAQTAPSEPSIAARWPEQPVAGDPTASSVQAGWIAPAAVLVEPEPVVEEPPDEPAVSAEPEPATTEVAVEEEAEHELLAPEAEIEEATQAELIAPEVEAEEAAGLDLPVCEAAVEEATEPELQAPEVVVEQVAEPELLPLEPLEEEVVAEPPTAALVNLEAELAALTGRPASAEYPPQAAHPAAVPDLLAAELSAELPEPVTQAVSAEYDVAPPAFLMEAARGGPRRWPAVAGVLLGLGLGVAAFQTSGLWFPWLREVTSRPGAGPGLTAVPTVVPVALSAEERDGTLHIRWNPQSNRVKAADRAIVTLGDGDVPREILLSRQELGQGLLTYKRESERVDVALRMMQGDKPEVRETTTFVGKLPGQALPGGDAALQKERDDLLEQVGKLKADLATQTTRYRRLERTLEETRKSLQVEQRRRLGNMAPPPK